MNTPYSLTGARINFNTAGDNTVLPQDTTGVRFIVWRLRLSVAGATTIQIKDGSGTILEVFNLGVNGAINLEAGDHAHYATSTNNGLVINSSNAVQVDGRVSYERR